MSPDPQPERQGSDDRPALVGRLGRWLLARPEWPALGLYLACALGSLARTPETVNPDAVCYVRLSDYLAAGRFADFASGYWSPLLPASMVPLQVLGLGGVAAARLALVVWGAVFILCGLRLARRLAAIPEAWRPALAAVLALTAAWYASFAITPDLVVAACLLLYFSLSLEPRLFAGRGRALLCGLAGGLCYLAKAYALPFFLLHFPATVALRYWTERRPAESPGAGAESPPPRPGSAWAALAAGVLGFALVAGPWIGALSAKHGGFTFSTAGGPNHAISGPPPGSPVPMAERLWTPEPGRISIWETPEKLVYPLWSPFEGAAGLVRQVGVAYRNLRYMRSCFDTLGLTLGLLGATPLLLILLWRRQREAFVLLWGAGTLALYCSGYLLVYVEERYLAPVVWPLGCILCLHFAGAALSSGPVVGALAPDRLRLARLAAVALIVASFAGYPLGRVLFMMAGPRGDRPAYGELAERLRGAGLSGPVASSRYSDGLNTAFRWGQPYLGTPAPGSPAARQAELARHGARVFLVWFGDDPAETVPAGSPWEPAGPGEAPWTGPGYRVKVLVYRDASR